jgi:hypothetical protein
MSIKRMLKELAVVAKGTGHDAFADAMIVAHNEIYELERQCRRYRDDIDYYESLIDSDAPLIKLHVPE